MNRALLLVAAPVLLTIVGTAITLLTSGVDKGSKEETNSQEQQALQITDPLPTLVSEIACPGEYGGHLQGLATDDEQNIYWSFTVALVKTTKDGELLVTVEAPTHQGDLTYVDGKLYVAVNLGKFNEEPGQANSWVYEYDADNFRLLSKYPAKEVVHGAGGIAFHDGAFMVVGGLPKSYGENYVYEYDRDFRFVKRHVVHSGNTNMGIQTACYFEDAWWFGCYEDELGLLKVDKKFELLKRQNPNYSYGIARWTEGAVLQGISERVDGQRQWKGRARVSKLE